MIPIIIPKVMWKVLPFPITFIVRHIPTPNNNAETIPKVYVNISAGLLAFLSNF